MSIRILIADDHEMVRLGLQRLFDGTEIEIVAEADSTDEALRVAAEMQLDVILFDISWKCDQPLQPNGFPVIAGLKAKNPKTPVLIFSMHDNPIYMKRCHDLGAGGYVVKGSSGTVLLEAIRSVAAGEELWGHVK